jgi:hypothetical protein
VYYKGAPWVRAASKLKREALRLPGLRQLHGYAHHEALEEHSTKLPPLDPRDLPIFEGIRRTGVYVAPLDTVGFAETAALVTALEVLVRELRAMPTDGDNAPRLPIARVAEFPDVFLWGLSERLLRLIENYIGLPVRYHGADLRREIADGRPTDVRQWHIDTEDHRMFKVIVYLNDVEPGGGPFEYIPREQTLMAAGALGYGSGFVADDVMEGVMPRSRWTPVLGKAFTAAFVDTCRVFHRAQPPSKAERYSVTYSWTSTTPIKTYPTIHLPDAAYAQVTSRINDRQRAVLPPRGT